MAETIRSVSVHIEVDTNKQTYVLDRDDLDLAEVQDVVRDFIEAVQS